MWAAGVLASSAPPETAALDFGQCRHWAPVVSGWSAVRWGYLPDIGMTPSLLSPEVGTLIRDFRGGIFILTTKGWVTEGLAKPHLLGIPAGMIYNTE